MGIRQSCFLVVSGAMIDSKRGRGACQWLPWCGAAWSVAGAERVELQWLGGCAQGVGEQAAQVASRQRQRRSGSRHGDDRPWTKEREILPEHHLLSLLAPPTSPAHRVDTPHSLSSCDKASQSHLFFPFPGLQIRSTQPPTLPLPLLHSHPTALPPLSVPLS